MLGVVARKGLDDPGLAAAHHCLESPLGSMSGMGGVITASAT